MENLFEGLGPDAFSEPEKPEVRVREKGNKETKKPVKKLSGLDALFQEAFDEGVKRDRTRRKPRPKSGLDSLVRNTMENSRLAVDYGARKRVTFLFDKEKLEKLKSIAREENQYLKDIISQIVSEYLEKHKE
ncbi:MAG: hypothetical protein GYB31_13600 [Bacteroidetes bacterium]|nr:hypothetical protein [Bacteroidota bacterium]